MSSRGLCALASILLTSALQGFAYHSTRNFLAIDLRDGGASAVEVGTAFAILVGVTIAGVILGGVASFGAGPWTVVAGSMALAAVGHGALVAGAPLLWAMVMTTLGAGMFHCASLAAAADLLTRDDEGPAPPATHRFAALAAFIVLSVAAVNVGAGIGGAVTTLLRTSSAAPAHRGALAVAVVAAVTAAIAAHLGRGPRRAGEGRPLTGPYRAAVPAAPALPAPAKTALAGLGLLLVPEVFRTLGAEMSSVPFDLASRREHLWVYGVQPLALTFASLVVFVVLLRAARGRSTKPPLVLLGGGLTVAAVGFLAIAVADGGSVSLYALGATLAAFGDAPLHAVPLAYAALALRGRAAPLSIAAWLVVTRVVRSACDTLAAVPGLRAPALGLAALACLTLGAALFVYARRFHLRFFDPPAAPADA